MKAIIVDDEELARSRLSILLSEIKDVTLCGSFGAAAEAMQYIEENPVDVVFLDISMPEMDGMEFANLLLERQSSARVVFVTGYEEYAVEAFAVEAVDYLLKPISRERLAKTMQRFAKKQQFQAQRLYVFCFGGFRVSVQADGDETINWRSPKVEELFALLVCKGSVSRDEIIDTLWEDFPLGKAMKNLNSTVYYIRRALQQYGLEDCMVTTRRQISLDRKKFTCDLYEFERLQKSAWNTEQELEQLNELYRGELFQGKTYEWSFGKAQTLEKNMISNLLQAAEQREVQKRPEEAERLYMRALEINPFHETACGKLLDFYIRTGRKEKAKQLRKEMDQILSEEAPPLLLAFRKRV
ncbi:response regulator [Clostridium aminobutyricum]|uniref:Stage 0 sporulation protein A homolog n=1 Tax=Clostridium aminobutyricum TaxID=33953 RepID=A0A939DA58_CLOAM|nr:response regulator [Clostridium aminobutyricum]MBN7773538.1 response regulator [Clostridium aminobutyricum]